MTVDKEYKLRMIGDNLHCSAIGILAKIQAQTILTEEALANVAEVNEKCKGSTERVDGLLLRKTMMDTVNSVAKLHALLAVLTVNPALRMYEDLVEKEIDVMFVKAIEGKLSEIDENLFNEQERLKAEAQQSANATWDRGMLGGPIMVNLQCGNPPSDQPKQSS